MIDKPIYISSHMKPNDWRRASPDTTVPPAPKNESILEENQAGVPAIDAANRINRKKMAEINEAVDREKARSKQDSLCDCLNRDALNDFLDKFNPRKRGVIVYLDLRDFKSVNDTYGHAAGDLTLQEVVNQLNTHFRIKNSGGDFLFRCGGDEFVLVCQDMNEDKDFSEFINKIKAKLEQIVAKVKTEINNQKIEIDVYVDYGVSEYPATIDNKNKPNLAAAMNDADEKMYTYKQKRNTFLKRMGIRLKKILKGN